MKAIAKENLIGILNRIPTEYVSEEVLRFILSDSSDEYAWNQKERFWKRVKEGETLKVILKDDYVKLPDVLI